MSEISKADLANVNEFELAIRPAGGYKNTRYVARLRLDRSDIENIMAGLDPDGCYLQEQIAEFLSEGTGVASQWAVTCCFIVDAISEEHAKAAGWEIMEDAQNRGRIKTIDTVEACDA